MITTKRQIRRDTDRFGGYGTESVRSTVISDYDRIGNAAAPSADQDVINDGARAANVDVNIVNPAPQQSAAYSDMYTTLATASITEKQTATEVPPRPVRQERPREREDILPTVKTRKYATEKIEANDEQAVSPVRRERRALDSRTKILLCVYVAVALVLAIAVITTGVSISNASAQADVLSGQIAQKQAVIVEQESVLADLRNDATIRDKATEMGMVSAGDPSYSAPDVESVGYPQAKPHTNAFDKFCDWLSKVMY